MARPEYIGTWSGSSGRKTRQRRDRHAVRGWRVESGPADASGDLGFCERWRNLPKPTMVEVHGKVIAGGVMLVWPFDIVIASEDATFQDNTVAMGICGAEFFNASGGGADRNRAARCSVEDPVTPDVGCSELAP